MSKRFKWSKYPYQLLINKKKSVGITYLDDSNTITEYSNDMYDIYKNVEEYNPNKRRKILIVLDDMIADNFSNEKVNPIVTELFIRGRELNNPIVTKLN